MTDRRPGRHALAFVLVTVLLDVIGIGLVLPVLPGLIGRLADVDVSTAAAIGGWLFVAYSGMQFLFAPVIGNLSDAFGRRPVLLAAVAGLGIDYAVTAFAPTIGWLFAGRLAAGVFGGSFATANAYIADITAPADRAKTFGMVGAAFGLGFILGPALGGLLGGYGDRVPFFAAAALSAANFLYGWVVLPETLPKDRRRPFRLRRANPFGALTALRKPALRVFAGVITLHFLAVNVYPAVWAYFTSHRFGWSTWDIGVSLAVYGVFAAVVQGGLVAPAIRRFGEWNTALIALSVEVLAGLGYAFAGQGWMIYVLLAVAAPQNMAMPAINAMMSHRVDSSEQGELQGAVSSLMGLTSIVGPLMATQLFWRFTGPDAPAEVPGAPFLAAAAMSLVAVVLFLRAGRSEGLRTPSKAPGGN